MTVLGRPGGWYRPDRRKQPIGRAMYWSWIRHGRSQLRQSLREQPGAVLIPPYAVPSPGSQGDGTPFFGLLLTHISRIFQSSTKCLHPCVFHIVQDLQVRCSRVHFPPLASRGHSSFLAQLCQQVYTEFPKRYPVSRYNPEKTGSCCSPVMPFLFRPWVVFHVTLPCLRASAHT
jgi:hypothetical protein